MERLHTYLRTASFSHLLTLLNLLVLDAAADAPRPTQSSSTTAFSQTSWQGYSLAVSLRLLRCVAGSEGAGGGEDKGAGEG
jgi:hypothetical protein